MKLALSLIALLSFTTGCGVFDPMDSRHGNSGGNHNNDPTTPHSGDQQNSKACDASAVQHIQRPYYSDNAQGGTFSYAFEYVPPTNESLPTVVYIPGGPGQTAIGDDEEWKKKLPAGFGYLLTDPRGVGCNSKSDDYPQNFYKSRYVADDVNAAIKQIGLTNYYLYGISYGTLVATITASKAEAGDAPAPHAVILEGTLGRAFQGNEADSTYESLWQAKLDKSPDLAAAFSSTSLPLGYSSDDWISVIRMGLMIGQIKLDTGEVVDYLDKVTSLAISSSSTDQARARKAIEGNKEDSDSSISSGGADTFYGYIACQEIWPALYQSELTNGRLTEDTVNLCAKAHLSFTAEKFDAAKWPIKAPIYYFDGSNDPATPIVLANYHFQAEATSPQRQLAIVQAAGHNPFGLSLTDCSDTVWQAMMSGTGFKEALKGCGWTPGITLQTASGSTSL